ncbi:hypothetical protein D0U04_07680 [Bacillus clarus]|uniref:Group-specific protein n=1 Tax=Bacillus clarus TaxID=2338372 RepID=A0A090Z2U9_9BACI|nr:hypothetical protein [Bacillus clarus]KFM98745.1 hypothetical protein DJ93_4874 [Bacillus clarus]RFT67682.1 hypothetical protein D0U04_07680 [Bacillus clarus]
MYIFIGSSLLLILLIFLFAKKFAPNSFMMTSFKGNGFKKFVIGILIASAFSLSYGIYHATTYQPSFLDITLQNKQYTIFGNIGKYGYFSEELIKKNKKTELYVVSWKQLNLKEPQILIDYPSGEQDTWKPNISLLSTNKLKKKQNIKEIYRFSPFEFKETGKVTLTIKENDSERGKVSIEVK